MTTQPSIGSYMQHSSNNYGVNSLYFECGDLRVYFSYQTPVAFWTPTTGIVCRENDWSATTGKHLNAIQPKKSKRIVGRLFEEQLSVVVDRLGMSLPAVA